MLASIFLPKTSDSLICFVAVTDLVTPIDLEFRPPGAFMSRLFLGPKLSPSALLYFFFSIFFFFCLVFLSSCSGRVPGSCPLGPSFCSATAKGRTCTFHPPFSLSQDIGVRGQVLAIYHCCYYNFLDWQSIYPRAKFCNTLTHAHQFPQIRCVLSFFCGGVSQPADKYDCFNQNSEELSPVCAQSLRRSWLHFFPIMLVIPSPALWSSSFSGCQTWICARILAHVLCVVLSYFAFAAGRESWIPIGLFLSLCSVSAQIAWVWEEIFWFYSSEWWSVIL